MKVKRPVTQELRVAKVILMARNQDFAISITFLYFS